MEPKTKLDISDSEAAAIRAKVQQVLIFKGALGPSRLATLGDAPAILALLEDDRVSGDVYTLPRPFSLDSIRGWIKDHQKQAENGEGLLMLARDKVGDVISIVDFQFWPQYAACEFGGVIAAHMQSQSVGTNGIKHLCDWVFTEIGVRLIVLTASRENIRTQKLLTGLGFQRMGEMDSVRPDGTTRRSLYWELLQTNTQI